MIIPILSRAMKVEEMQDQTEEQQVILLLESVYHVLSPFISRTVT